MPSHNHAIFGGGGGADNVTYNSNGPDGSNSFTGNGRPTEAAGGNQPHNNVQPYITLNFIIKT